jgi:hypothetical protein
VNGSKKGLLRQGSRDECWRCLILGGYGHTVVVGGKSWRGADVGMILADLWAEVVEVSYRRVEVLLASLLGNSTKNASSTEIDVALALFYLPAPKLPHSIRPCASDPSLLSSAGRAPC